METVTLSVKLVNTILNYLATKPYMEVQGLIAEVHTEVNHKSSEAAVPQQAPTVEPDNTIPKCVPE